MKHLIKPILALVALCVSIGVNAADPAKPTRNLDPGPVVVQVADLNLSNPGAVRTLYHRITAAAQKACGPALGDWYPGVSANMKECYAQTVDQTVKRINNPLLSALHKQPVTVASR